MAACLSIWIPLISPTKITQIVILFHVLPVPKIFQRNENDFPFLFRFLLLFKRKSLLLSLLLFLLFLLLCSKCCVVIGHVIMFTVFSTFLTPFPCATFTCLSTHSKSTPNNILHWKFTEIKWIDWRLNLLKKP